MGDADGSVRWQLIFCRQRMALVYSPNSRFRADLDAVAAGRLPWYEVIQRPGFVLKRGDPRNDPGGYRGVLVFRLAELHEGIDGLADRIMQGDDNEAQIAGWRLRAAARLATSMPTSPTTTSAVRLRPAARSSYRTR